MTIDTLKHEEKIPVVVADEQGFIMYVNKCFEKIFEWRSEEIIGQSLTVIIPKHLRDAHHLGFSRFLTTGISTLLNRPLKLNAVTKIGREFQAEHVIVAEASSGHWTFAASIKPLDS